MNPKPRIKQYGLQRSGTNYLRWLLEHNLHALVLTNCCGDKHSTFKPQEFDKAKVRGIVVSVKNPYSWLVSLFRWGRKGRHYNLATPFSLFLRTPVRNPQEPSRLYRSPIEWWCHLNRHWTALPDSMWVRHDDALFRPANVLAAAKSRFGLRASRAEVQTTDSRIAPTKLKPMQKPPPHVVKEDFPLVVTGQRIDAAYYRDRKYMDYYSSSDKELIAKVVDEALMAKFGYGLERA